MTLSEATYRSLIKRVIGQGDDKPSRNMPMREIFGEQFTFFPGLCFPLFTGRKLFPKGMLGELSAFLKGATTVAEFEAEGCNYWKQWADGAGNLGVIYGSQWRDFNGEGVDQLTQLVDDLQTNPTSRRLMVTAWNPAKTDSMALPPCHYSYQCNVTQGRLNMIVVMRSLDVMIGLPSDAVVFASLMILLCNDTGLTPGKLIFQVGSCHIYSDHLADAEAYIARTPIVSPTIVDFKGMGVFNFDPRAVSITDYIHHEPLNFALHG